MTRAAKGEGPAKGEKLAKAGRPASGNAQGRLIESSLTVDDALIRRYAAMTADGNLLHLDPSFAAATPMGGIIAHGTLSLAPLWQALERTLGFEALAGVVLDIRFKRPVRPGDVITAGGTRRRDGRSFDVWVEARDGTRVIEGVVLAPAHPPPKPRKTKGMAGSKSVKRAAPAGGKRRGRFPPDPSGRSR